jgi:hypothetical protein
MKYALHGHTEIAAIIFFTAALFCATKLLMWFQQPYYMALDIPEHWYGFLMAAGWLLGGLCSHFSHKILPGLNNIQMLCLAWGMAITISVFSAVVVGLHGVGLLMLGGSLIYAAAMPRVSEAINMRVGPERRATIISTANLMPHAAFILMAPVIGLASDAYGIGAALYVNALWLVLSGGFLVLWAAKRKKRAG